MDKGLINTLRNEYGDAFYLLDSKQFRLNFKELKEAFSNIYPNFNIAYSYKTNYTPKLCKIVDELNGYAEVVSEMEAELAIKVGVKPENIIWNGPIKDKDMLEKYLLLGVSINIDSIDDFNNIKKIIESYPNRKFSLGIRINFDVLDGVISRFGFDTETEEFLTVLNYIKENDNVVLNEIQCHFAKRNVEYWQSRAKGMVNVLDKYNIKPKRIDLGGGIFGKMPEELKKQFSANIVPYTEYAKAAATVIYERYKDEEVKPELVIEPGSALVGDCMSFLGTVKGIKNVRGKWFASVLASQKNISMSGVNPPIEVINMSEENKEYENLDFVGYTCIEGDVIYRNYNGKLALGDVIIISNCGSYSIVMKPPFILPNFPIIDISSGKVELIKRKECFEDIFRTYNM